MTTKNRLVTTGKTADDTERQWCTMHCVQKLYPLPWRWTWCSIQLRWKCRSPLTRSGMWQPHKSIHGWPHVLVRYGKYCHLGQDELQAYQIMIFGANIGERVWQILFLLGWNCHHWHTKEALQYRNSWDQKVSAAGTEVRTGRKWRVERAVEMAKLCLRQKELEETLVTRRADMGFLAWPIRPIFR